MTDPVTETALAPREDDDIMRLRHRAQWSLEASRDRRRAAKPISDLVSDTMLLLMMGATIALIVTLALMSAGAEARADTTRPPSRVERTLRAVCPKPSAMPRPRCVRWLRVAQCETGGQQRRITHRSLRQIRWRYDGPSGYDGGLQFGVRTWRGNIGRVAVRDLTRAQHTARRRGSYRVAHRAPASVQILAAEELRVRPDGGLSHWPSCGSRW